MRNWNLLSPEWEWRRILNRTYFQDLFNPRRECKGGFAEMSVFLFSILVKISVRYSSLFWITSSFQCNKFSHTFLSLKWCCVLNALYLFRTSFSLAFSNYIGIMKLALGSDSESPFPDSPLSEPNLGRRIPTVIWTISLIRESIYSSSLATELEWSRRAIWFGLVIQWRKVSRLLSRQPEIRRSETIITSQ